MGKWTNDLAMDAALDFISLGTVLTVCSAQPTTLTEAVTTFKLADIVTSSTDFTISNGDVSGRKVRVGEQAAIPVDSNGTANHIAICDASTILLVTTCTPQAVTAGNTVTVPAFDSEWLDPA
jgi:hypothetical protein